MAAVLALIAGGVLITSNFLGFTFSSLFRVPEREWVARMSQAAVQGGGYALTFSGPGSENWKVGPGHQLERFSVESGDAAFARLTSTAAFNGNSTEWEKLGLTAALPVEFNNQTKGQMIEIGVVARAPSVKPSDAIMIMYATQQAGNSGWQRLALGRDFELLKFTYKVPTVEGEYIAKPIIVIHSDAQGRGRMADILGVYVKRYTAAVAGQ